MILDDALIDRVYRLGIETLRLTAQGVALVREDATFGEVGTGVALFAGVGSPLTQARGFAYRSPGDVQTIEAFFAPRTDDWEVSIDPFTDPGTVRRLLDVGYRPGQFEGTLAQRVESVQASPSVDVVEVGDDLHAWSETTWRGWMENEDGAFAPDDLVRSVSLMPSRRYLAYVDGVPAASASMMEIGDAVVLGGAATRVPFRGRGLQSALLARRLLDAGRGRLAVIGAMPGTQSYRNAQRSGFVPLYSTLTLMRH